MTIVGEQIGLTMANASTGEQALMWQPLRVVQIP